MPKRKEGRSKLAPMLVISQDEEPDFPRGGAGVLTRDEILEARSHADEAFEDEERPPKKHKNIKAGTRQDGDMDTLFQGGLTAKLPKSVNMLRYKSLFVGMKIWGSISEIGNKDITVSLPGGLRGFVRAEEATDLSAEGVEGLDKEMPVKEHEKHILSLRESFSVGQLVACTVIKLDRTKGKGDKKPSKRIELSLKLGTLHEGLTIDAMHEGLVVWSYIVSVEDHGYLLSFGVPAMSGFLLYRDFGDGESGSKMKVGQLVQGAVASVDKKRGMVMLNAKSSVVASSATQELEGLTLELLVPGTLVNGRVRAVLKNGLLVSFLTYFTGTVDIFHLEDTLPSSNWSDSYSENQRLKARILYVDVVSKLIGLTLNTHLVQNLAPVVDVEVGKVFENALVCRVDPTIGILLKLASKNASTAGYVHISNVSDEHIEKLEKKFKVGKKVQARVIGLRQMDGLAIVTLKESKVKQQLLGYSDVKPAMTVVGEITAVEPFGAFVKLADGLKALCPLQHMSEFQRVKPSSKFQVGAKLKFRVLSCDSQLKKITLTHKKNMLLSKLSPIASYEDALEGLVSHGWISGIEEYGCFVCFYNDVKGLAHRTELGLDPGAKADSSFQIGQVVKCRVLRADPVSRRLSLSFILSPRRFVGSDSSETVLETTMAVGAEVCGIVAHMTDRKIILDIPLSKGFARGIMQIEHLTDSLGHIEQLKSVIQPGYKFERLLVLERDELKMVVSAKFSLLNSAKSLPSDISQLHPQAVIPGYIASITDAGCFVRFLGGLTGLASVPQVSDGFVHNPSQYFSVGQSARAQVLEVNETSGRFTLCLKQSRCYSMDASLIQGYFLEEEKIAELQAKDSSASELDWAQSFVIGNYVEGEIQDIKDYGVIVNLHDHKDVVGFITHYQMGNQVDVGKQVKARILDVVKADGIVDLTLRSELLRFDISSDASKKRHVLKRKNSCLNMHQKVHAVVELVKDEYLVLSLPEHDNRIAFASTRDYNVQMLDPHQRYTTGQRLEATVQALEENSQVGRLLLLLSHFSDPTAISTFKRVRREPMKYEAGSFVKGEVIAVRPLELHLKIADQLYGRIHVTEVRDEYVEGNPLSSYTVGQQITAKVLGRSRLMGGSKEAFLDLTIRPSELLETNANHQRLIALPTISTLSVGQIVIAYVKEVTDDWAWLLLSSRLKGRLFVLDSSTDPVHLKSFKNRFQIGQAVRCCVSMVDHEKGLLDLSLHGVEVGEENGKSDSQEEMENMFEIKKGCIIGGRVAKVFPGAGGLSVQIGSHHFGRVHVTHLLDCWKDNPETNFEEGQFVRCRVLEMTKTSKGSEQVDLSLRPTLGGCAGNDDTQDDLKLSTFTVPPVEKIEELRPNMEVQGYIKSVSKKGCFVTLSRHIDARVLISDLSDKFIDDPVKQFPPGKLVKGRILSIETLSGRVDMTLKSTFQNEASKQDKSGKKQQLLNLHVGDVVSGVIRRIEEFGLFIAIDHSDIVGLCHISEVSENYINSLEMHFKVGDTVKVKILKVDAEKNRVYLGMKEEYFRNLTLLQGFETKVAMGSEVDNDHPFSSSVHFDAPSLLEHNLSAVENTSESENEEANYEDGTSGGIPEVEKRVAFVPPLDVVLDIHDDVSQDDKQLSTENSLASEQNTEDSTKLSKRAKKRLKEEREATIRAAEQRRLEGDLAPENIDDFEKLVHESPNSSFVWIKYMAFMLSLADIEKARSIAERALQTINFREEGEKLNVWVAYLNLENVYGSPPKEAVLQVFQRALQYCDPKKLYLALLGIYERSEQHEMADQLLKTMSRKFRTSAKIWLRQIQYLLKRGSSDAAHKALDRAVLSLPRRKHIKVISKSAILEFKIGSHERARAMFEGILRNYPKRLDLWSVYLDQEICLGHVTVIRALFERVTCLELPPKKMKFLFKKYLDYEKSQGDAERVEHVKAKALEYVESKLG